MGGIKLVDAKSISTLGGQAPLGESNCYKTDTTGFFPTYTVACRECAVVAGYPNLQQSRQEMKERLD